jgi:IS1 family transposase
VLRVPEQNVHSIGPAEPSRQQPVQVNTLRIQAKALHSITIFTRGCRTLRCRWHLMSGALTFFRCCFMDSCQVLHASCGGHNALILKPTQHETCRLNPGQQHPTSASADCRDAVSTTASRISHVARHSSHVVRHTPDVTRHTSHVTRHTSHVTRHTAHVTRHTSHVTLHKTQPHIIFSAHECRITRSSSSHSPPQRARGLQLPLLPHLPPE